MEFTHITPSPALKAIVEEHGIRIEYKCPNCAHPRMMRVFTVDELLKFEPSLCYPCAKAVEHLQDLKITDMKGIDDENKN